MVSVAIPVAIEEATGSFKTKKKNGWNKTAPENPLEVAAMQVKMAAGKTYQYSRFIIIDSNYTRMFIFGQS
jgi:hypothetical protein